MAPDDDRAEQPSGGLPPKRVEAIRWRLVNPVGFRRRFAVLATDRLRQAVVHGLDRSSDPEDFLLGGHQPTSHTMNRWGRHAHAHWLWTESNGIVNDLIVWVPAGLNPIQVRRVVSISELPRWPQEPEGYSGGALALQQIGEGLQVVADLGAGIASAEWSTTTPLLTSWHRKLGVDPTDLLARYLDRELKHRLGEGAPHVVDLEAHETTAYFTRRWDTQFPFHPAFQVSRMVLSRPVEGVLCLGALSHFGFGRWEPQ